MSACANTLGGIAKPGALAVDRLEFGRLLHEQIGRLCVLEDPVQVIRPTLAAGSRHHLRRGWPGCRSRICSGPGAGAAPRGFPGCDPGAPRSPGGSRLLERYRPARCNPPRSTAALGESIRPRSLKGLPARRNPVLEPTAGGQRAIRLIVQFRSPPHMPKGSDRSGLLVMTAT